MADILQQQQLWPQDRMWVNLTPAQKCRASRANQHPQLCWAVLTIHLTWPKRQMCHSAAATHFYSPRS